MTFYMSAIILTELMMIAMILHVLHYSGFTREQKAWYVLTVAAVLLCSAAEFAVHCGRYDAKFAIPLTILTVLQFSTAPLLGVLFSGALGLPGQKKIAIWFFVANLVAETVAAPFGWVSSWPMVVFRSTVKGSFTVPSISRAALLRMSRLLSPISTKNRPLSTNQSWHFGSHQAKARLSSVKETSCSSPG